MPRAAPGGPGADGRPGRDRRHKTSPKLKVAFRPPGRAARGRRATGCQRAVTAVASGLETGSAEDRLELMIWVCGMGTAAAVADLTCTTDKPM